MPNTSAKQGGTQTARRPTMPDVRERSPATAMSGGPTAATATAPIVTLTMKCVGSRSGYEGHRLELEAIPASGSASTDGSGDGDGSVFWDADGSTLPGTLLVTGLAPEIGKGFTVGEQYTIAFWNTNANKQT